MRVLLFSAIPRSDRGGVQKVIAGLEEELATHAIPKLRLGPDEVLGAETMPFALEAAAASSGRPRLTAMPEALGSAMQLAGVLRKFRPTVVNVHFVTGALAYFLALRPFFGYRLVVSTHGSDILQPPPSLKRHLPRFLRMADAITVVSEPVAQAVKAAAPTVADKLSIIPNGIDSDFWTPGSEARQPLIVASGRLHRVKGFDILLDSLAALPEAQAAILGDGPLKDELSQMARQTGVSDRLTMPGHLEPDAIRNWLRRSSVFAMPSRSEGLPLALLEALACGVPAVASNVGGVPTVLTPESGVLVPPEDPIALRNGLAAVLDGKTAASGAGARRRAEHFSRRAMLDAYIALLDEQSRRGPAPQPNHQGATA